MSLLYLGILFFKSSDTLQYVYFFHCIDYIIVFLLVEIAFLFFPKSSFNLILIFIAILCAKESYLLVSQLLGFTSSNGHFILSGSFNNPGPCGGYLAICISLFIPYIVNAKRSSYFKFTYYVVLVSLIIAIIILPSTQSRSAGLGLACSMVLFVAGTDSLKDRVKVVMKKCGLLILLGIVVIGMGAYFFKKPSADGRLFMDKISIQAMFSNDIKGAGIGHFGGSYGCTQYDYFKQQICSHGNDDLDWRAINEHDRLTADCPDHAFNEYLFLGVEFGPLAMLLFLGVIVSAIFISFRKGTIWCYGLTSFSIFALFSYPLHVWQFQMILPILLAAAICDGDVCASRKKIHELVLLLITIVLFSLEAWSKKTDIKQFKQAETTWKKAERWHKQEYYEYVVEDCDSLLPYMKHNERFLFAYGQSLNKIGNYLKSDSILKMGTEISSDAMFWNVMGNNSLALGKYREAEECYKHAFYMVPNRLYPFYLLAKLYHAEGDTIRFLDMADRVETFKPKVESVNTERLRKEIRDIKAEYNSENKQK